MRGPPPVFALLTDFGLSDPYAGQMKAAPAKAGHYAMPAPDATGILPGGQGYYEIARNKLSASEILGIKPGDTGAITPVREP